MPTYEYRCANGHNFEVVQRMSDDPVKVCEVCGAPVQRVFHPVAVHFKGSGFYSTDYGRARGGGGGDSASKDESKTKDESQEGDHGLEVGEFFVQRLRLKLQLLGLTAALPALAGGAARGPDDRALGARRADQGARERGPRRCRCGCSWSARSTATRPPVMR